ncbi:MULTISPECIES: hypothetical protein [Sphingobacterium]|uniref:hypothetical protein n=1 Tax=Sphingobacterium TaxID=28453 RepID=UPI0013DC88C9|nr:MULTISPECIES: hypothetical protein [unclassified Sphingobacterium]
MNYNDLPFFVKESVVLSMEEKNMLSSINTLPSEQEVDLLRNLPDVLELTNTFIGDESSRTIHLQLKAREYLSVGDIFMAWKVLLL